MIAVRAMMADDVPSVVRLQTEDLEGSTLTALGPAFLSKFHRASLAHPRTLGFVAVGDTGIVGFALVTTDVHAYNTHVKARIALPMLRAILNARRARVAIDVIRGVFDAEPTPYVPAELLLLVVDRNIRRQHVGRQLLEALERGFGAAGVRQYRVAVRSHLETARKFYQATGFEFEQQLTILGRPMTYLLKRMSA